ncbi:endonuclease [Haliangium sp.]|uniref:endonuclease n=1 Tax=Haliangium sp. TaxID=2663208 RepID=UPI003D0F2C18
MPDPEVKPLGHDPRPRWRAASVLLVALLWGCPEPQPPPAPEAPADASTAAPGLSDARPDDSSAAPSSCLGRCGRRAPAGCWCDQRCSSFRNCCADYHAVCVAADAGTNPTPDDAGALPNDAGAPPDAGSDPWPSLSDEALLDALHAAAKRGHQGLSYDAARDHLFGNRRPSIDVHDGQIECIYTGLTVAPDGSRQPHRRINTEHSWPKSDGAKGRPRESDMHHLFPTEIQANSRRGSHPYGETVCEAAGCPWAQGGSEFGRDSSGRVVFEVRPRYRGDVARAHFYFAARYRKPIPDAEERVLRAWHEQDPVSERERRRNTLIEEAQGNRNPFVDHPGVIDRISDF